MSGNTENLSLQSNKDITKTNNQFIDYQIVGRTSQKRRMEVVIIGKLVDPKLKIFIMSGQHGDEKLSRKATEQLMSHLIKTNGKEFADVSIAVLSNANPDGAANNKRTTSENIDMNRDHLLSRSKEVRLIHSFIRSWKPHLIIDVHTFPPTREYLKKKNYVFNQDIFVDWPTNLGVRRNPDTNKLHSLIKDIQSTLDPLKCLCDRYVLINPDGRIRHSSDDILGARNFLSLRYDTLTIIIEGREVLPEEDPKTQSQLSISAQYNALLSTIKWSMDNISFLTDNTNLHSYNIGDMIAIRFKYNPPDKKYIINLKNKLTNKIEEVFFSEYYYYLKPTRMVRIPYGYAVPINNNKVIRLLHRHGLISIRNTELNSFTAQKYLVISSNHQKPKTKKSPRPPTKIRLISLEEEDNLVDYEIFFTSQAGGHLLPFLLEPQSKYGLTRYKELKLTINPGDTYPIVRVIKSLETKKDLKTETKKDIKVNKPSSAPIRTNY